MKSRPAFTLIELLVVVAIIAILIAILVPSLGRARQQAYQVKCAANLHSIGFGILYFAEDHQDRLPWMAAIRAGPRGLDLGFRYRQRGQNARRGQRDPMGPRPLLFAGWRNARRFRGSLVRGR